MLLTQTQLTELTREYYKTQPNHERMGQWLINRTPLKLVDPDLFYEVDNAIAIHKYQDRYIVASPEEVSDWSKACDKEGVPKVDIQEVKNLIQEVEFNTSGASSCYVTTCILTTNFGFKVIGKSGTIHEDRFNEGIGKRFSFDNAFGNLVKHHSYLVRYLLHQQGLTLARPKKKHKG